MAIPREQLEDWLPEDDIEGSYDGDYDYFYHEFDDEDFDYLINEAFSEDDEG